MKVTYLLFDAKAESDDAPWVEVMNVEQDVIPRVGEFVVFPHKCRIEQVHWSFERGEPIPPSGTSAVPVVYTLTPFVRVFMRPTTA